MVLKRVEVDEMEIVTLTQSNKARTHIEVRLRILMDSTFFLNLLLNETEVPGSSEGFGGNALIEEVVYLIPHSKWIMVIVLDRDCDR